MDMLKWWIILSIVALIIDAATSNIFFICFTAGGIAAMILNFIGASPIVQSIAFCVISILFLVVAIPFAKKALIANMPKVVSFEQKYIGKTITAEEDIYAEGTMQIDGIYWSLKNGGQPIKKGEKAIIVAVEGNKLIINKKLEEV